MMTMNRILVAFLVSFGTLTGSARQTAPLKVALTFDDLPAHGQLPPGETRFDVAKSILGTLKREKLPPGLWPGEREGRD